MISYLYIVTIIIDIRVGLFLLHGLESLLVLGLHVLCLLSGPDVPLLLLGELLLVLGLNLLNLAVRLAVVVAASVSEEELLQRRNNKRDYIFHQRINIIWIPRQTPST